MLFPFSVAKEKAKKYYDLVDRIWKDGVGGKDAAHIKAADLARGKTFSFVCFFNVSLFAAMRQTLWVIGDSKKSQIARFLPLFFVFCFAFVFFLFCFVLLPTNLCVDKLSIELGGITLHRDSGLF